MIVQCKNRNPASFQEFKEEWSDAELAVMHNQNPAVSNPRGKRTDRTDLHKYCKATKDWRNTLLSKLNALLRMGLPHLLEETWKAFDGNHDAQQELLQQYDIGHNQQGFSTLRAVQRWLVIQWGMEEKLGPVNDAFF